MKHRVTAVAIYAITTFALATFFDALYGAGPVVRSLLLIRLGIAATALFAIACLLSLFASRLGTACGLFGSILALPYFGIQAIRVPWGKLTSILPYANWSYMLTAILVLALSTIYSAIRLWHLLRSSS
jgi:hypothetical protein